MSDRRSFSALADVAVLELGSTLRAAYCGSFLAQLGAQVVSTRPPGAEPSRSLIGACAVEAADTLKLRVDDLAAAADAIDDTKTIVLITDEAQPPPSGLSIDVEVQLDVHDDATVAALRGIDGDALTASALSAASIAIGFPDRAPLPVPGEFVEHMAGLHGAVATVVALMRHAHKGERSSVRVAMDETLRFYVGMNAKMYENYPREWLREGRRAAGSAGQYPVGMFPCADGYVVIVSRSRADWHAIIAAMGSPDWATRPGWDDPLTVAESHIDEADSLLTAWLSELSCDAAVDLGRRHGFAIAPALDPGEATDTEQMRARDFVQLHDAGRATPVIRPTLPVIQSRSTGTGRPASALSRAKRPLGEVLAGVRVLDLSWVWAGPGVTMVLGALGADVVKVESSKRPDGSRLRGRPTVDGRPVEGPEFEVTPYFHQMNAGKRSIEVDLGSAEGQALLHALADESDVLVENMRPGVLERHELGYASLSETNPSLVYLSMTLVGQHGPLSDLKGYGSLMTALSGLERLVGYSKDDITGMLTVGVGDPNSAMYGVLAILAALLQREQTGHGAWLDLSQLEAMACGLIGTLSAFRIDRDAAWDYGNWHPDHAPWGTFPTKEGGWVALAVRSDREWSSFLTVLDDRQLRSADLADAAGRRRHRERLNALIAASTRRVGRAELVDRLLSAGVLAAPVLALGERTTDSFAAPARHSMPIEHPYGRDEILVTPPWDIDGDCPRYTGRAPLLGEHTDAILETISVSAHMRGEKGRR